MIFELDDHAGFTAIAAKGRLNMVAAPQLRTTVDQAIAAGPRRIVLDLAETDFLDSSGLGALVGCLKSARQAGGDLRIANAGEQVLMVLKLTSIDRILSPYASVRDAYGDV